MKVLVINGPNLNMLGIREPDIYGKTDYKALVKTVTDFCKKEGIKVKCVQSNCEGKLVDFIQSSYKKYDGIVINPGAYTHTSVAILDAVKAVGVPTVEVHISDVDSREDFRKVSFIRAACIKTISGEGINGFTQAISFLKDYIEVKK